MISFFDYTEEEIGVFVSEIRRHRMPLITRFWEKYGLPFIRYSFLPAFIIMAVLGYFYNEYNIQWLWVFIETIGLFYLIGLGCQQLVDN